MNKILIIIQREFLKRVRTKSFIILTIAMPFIMAALVIVPLCLSMIENDKPQSVAVIDPTGVYAAALRESKSFAFTAQPAITEEMRSEESPYDAVVAISGDLVKNKGKVTIYSHKEIPVNLLDYVQSKLNETVQKQKLQALGIASLDKIVDDVQRNVKMNTVRWSEEGDEQASSTYVAIIVGGIFMLLIYIFVLSYGSMIMQSVIEEKTNRIVELLVSSVKPFQLMMGKIIGVMLVGITQMALWGVMLSVIMTVVSVVFGIGQDPSMAAGQSMAAADRCPEPRHARNSRGHCEPSVCGDKLDVHHHVHWRLLALCQPLYRHGSLHQRARRCQPVCCTHNDDHTLWPLRRHVQHGQHQRSLGILDIALSAHIAHRDDDPPAIWRATVARGSERRLALCLGIAHDMGQRQNLSCRHTDVWQEAKHKRDNEMDAL